MRLPDPLSKDPATQRNLDAMKALLEATRASNDSAPVAVPNTTATTILTVTVPAAGSYLVVGSFAFAVSAAGSCRVGSLVRNSGTTAYGVQSAALAATIPTFITCTARMTLSRGDTVQLRAFQDTGGSLNTAPSATQPHTLDLIRLS